MAPSTARSGAAAAVAQQQRGSSSGGGNGGVLALAGLSVFVFSIYAGALLPVIAIARLLAYGLADATGWALLAAVAALTLAPIEWCDVPAARAAVGAICRAAVDYFPIKAGAGCCRGGEKGARREGCRGGGKGKVEKDLRRLMCGVLGDTVREREEGRM
eukprot:365676-Chlamydomonas_euryale.AAC.11